MKLQKKMPIVGGVMTSFPYFVETNEPVSRIERLMDEHHIRHVPVQENGKVVGVVTERDLHHLIKRSASLEEKERVRARDIMIANPYVVAFNTPLNEVVIGMAQRHIGSAIIVRRGKLAGILSSIDVCRILGEYLESTFPPVTDDDAA